MDKKEQQKKMLVNLGISLATNTLLLFFHIFSLILYQLSESSGNFTLLGLLFICGTTLLPILVGNLLARFLTIKFLPSFALPLFWNITTILICSFHFLTHFVNYLRMNT